MKKIIAIIVFALSVLFVSKDAKAVINVWNYTGMQMKIITSTGQQIGVSATTGLHVFDGFVPYPTGAVRTYPGYTGGGTGMGIVEWLTVGHPASGFPSSATSAYTWMSSLYGIIGYTVVISGTGTATIYLLPA